MENTQIVDNKKESKEPKSTKSLVLRILKIVGNVIFYVVIVLLFFFSLMNINSGGKGGIPNIFGKGYLSVQSDSMSGKVTYEEYKKFKIKSFAKGDLVNVDMLSKSAKAKLKVGDVITFWDIDIKAYNTHRIVYATYDVEFSDKKTKQVYTITESDLTTYPLINNRVYDATKGYTVYDAEADVEINYTDYISEFLTANNLKVKYSITSYSTQGDRSVSNRGLYNPGVTSDAATTRNYEIEQAGDIDTFDKVSEANVKAKVTSVSKGVGKTIDFIQSHWFGVFVIPVVILLLIELFFVVKNLMEYRAAKKAANAPAATAEIDLEAEKEKMRQELLAELKLQQEANENKPEIIEETEDTAVEAEEPSVEETKAEDAEEEKRENEE